MKISILLVVSFSILMMSFTHATVYHVDINLGDDSYPGTLEQPFKTIKHGSNVLEPGDKLLIHEGVYHEQIIGGKSGLPDRPIIYEGVNRDRVILRGSVTVKDWKKVGNMWIKVGLRPITRINAFVMVDEKHKLKQVERPQEIQENTFCLDLNNVYYIRLSGDANPNDDHLIDVYELDLAFNAGLRWGGTAKKHIVLRNMTLEKYGAMGVSAAPDQHQENSHWELDNLKVQYNQECGVFSALDDWFIHNCLFLRNRCHGCQINGARVKFINNASDENEWFGQSEYGGMGLLIGPDDQAHSCEVRGNAFKDNGYSNGYGCAIYLEGRSKRNVVEKNFIEGSTHAGIGFYGSSFNRVINNVLIDIAPKNFWRLTAAFVISHSLEGAPTQSVGNLIAFNTVWQCAAPVAVAEPSQPVKPDELNLFVNNLFSTCRGMLLKPQAIVATFEKNAWFVCPQSDNQLTSNLRQSAQGFLEKSLALGIDRLDVDPLVGVDPKLRNVAQNDFVPLPTSPLINAAKPIDYVVDDFRGTPRPQGPSPDIGAFEMTIDKTQYQKAP